MGEIWFVFILQFFFSEKLEVQMKMVDNIRMDDIMVDSTNHRHEQMTDGEQSFNLLLRVLESKEV